MERIQLSGSAMTHVQAYIEYKNIVGDADGGKLLSEEEYEEFKARAIVALKHRIDVSWRNSSGIDCKLIGPASKCFCGHNYKSHATDNYQDKNIFCRAKGCECALFDHLPVTGAWRIKCACKHFFDVHSVKGERPCKQPSCKCAAFYSPTSCTCGEKYGTHITTFETREERQALGRPVDNLGGGGDGYEALGGITSFSSLVDGVDRLDASGAGGRGITSNVGKITELGEEDQFPPPRKGKLSEQEEMDIYGSKYSSKSTRAPFRKK